MRSSELSTKTAEKSSKTAEIGNIIPTFSDRGEMILTDTAEKSLKSLKTAEMGNIIPTLPLICQNHLSCKSRTVDMSSSKTPFLHDFCTENWWKTSKFSPAAGQSPKSLIRKPPPPNKNFSLIGGLSYKGGFLNWNTPDTRNTQFGPVRPAGCLL